MMAKILIAKRGFSFAVQMVGIVVTITSLFAFCFARPNADHKVRKIDDWTSLSTWIDLHAFRNRAFSWLTAGIAFMFFGFYAVFFNLEEVYMLQSA
jgi:MFS transporter, MCT family, solute carrier family 16 (monocarboxylic acid transporters), member 10